MKTKRAFNINGFQITARMCKLSDKAFILTLFKESIFTYISAFYTPSIEMFEERFQSDYNEKRILLRGSRRIGMFQLSKRNNRLAITGLFLKKAYQGKGIAKHLMNYFEEIAKNHGYTEIELLVWENNPAKEFYKKMGYVIESKKDHKFLMVKRIE